jgi:GT2 family glycosyltransferase
MTISAVLINHNGGSTILRTIQSLLDQEQVWDQILLVDNASTDDSVEKVRQVYPSVQVVVLGENLGLPQARNIGLSKIQSELVLFMDDDVFLTPKSVQYMISAMQETGASVVCPRIVLHPENETVQCDGAFIHFAGMLGLRHSFERAALHSPTRTMTTGFIGASLLFDAKQLRELGGFDEDYFFYFEDMEMSFRLMALGHSICCEERAVALHERGAGTANLSFRGQGAYPVKRAYYSLRHRWLTILIHYQIWTLLLLSPALMLYEAAAFLESIRRGWLGAYFKAIFSLMQGWNTILKRRRYWGIKRKISDGSILSGGALPFSRGFVEPSKVKLIQMLDLVLNSYWKVVKHWLL